MATGIGAVLGALLVIWNALPALGVHVTPVPENANAAFGTLIAFVVGLFTKPPTPKDPAKTAANLAQAEMDHAKAVATYEKETGIPIAKNP